MHNNTDSRLNVSCWPVFVPLPHRQGDRLFYLLAALGGFKNHSGTVLKQSEQTQRFLQGANG
jgi:hypothetical protein